MQTQSTVQDVGSLIDKLAEKLSIPAAHLWSVLVRQAYVTLWQDVLFVVVFAVLAAFGALLWHKSNTFADADARFGSRMLVIIGSALLLILSLACISEIITVALNPEYYALQQVLDVIKQK